MATRIVDVGGFALASGLAAHGELRASAVVAPVAARSQFAAGTLGVSSTVSASALVSPGIAGALAVSASLTAAATVTSPTSLAGSLVNGSGTYAAATLPIPAWDTAYTVTVSSATLATTTPAVLVVLFPSPSPLNVDRTMTVTYTVGASRTWRIVHPLPGHANSADYLPTDGVHVEPGGAPGDETTVTYRWDASRQAVVVESTTGDAVTYDHSPDYATDVTFSMLFSPEAQALGTFSTIEARHVRAGQAIPSGTRDFLASVNTTAELVTAQEFYESIGWRVYSDPNKTSGLFGLTNDRSLVATVEESLGIEGQIMIHELGHVVSLNYLAADYPTGIDPAMPESGLTEYIYWPSTSDVRYEYVTEYEFTGSAIRSRAHIIEYNSSGDFVQEFDYWTNLTHGPFIENEAEVATLFAAVEDPGVYYLSQVDEFTAQSFARYWAGLNGSNTAGALNSMDSTVGDATTHARFVDYLKSIGAAPGSPSDTTAPGPVTGLSATAGTWVHPSDLLTYSLVELAWTNPAAADLASIRVRRASGSTAPATVDDGDRVVVGGPWTHITDFNVSSGTYSYAVFARDFAGNTSTAATVTVVVP